MSTQLQARQGLFLLHHRKAGGTSLRVVLDRHCKNLGLQFETIEGRPLDLHYLSSDWITITMLRDPIERIISLYRFDGRWPTAAVTTDAPVSIEKWLAGLDGETPGVPLWECVDNYYIRSMLGIPNLSNRIDRPEIEAAKTMLQRFDVVLLTELLSSTQTRDLLAKTLGLTQLLPHLRLKKTERQPREASDAMDIDPILIERLRKLNEPDYELYRFSQQLFEAKLKAL